MVLNQAEYCIHVLERFVVDKAKSEPTPIANNIDNLFERGMTSETGQNSNRKLPYRELQGSLLYLCTHNRPYITFAVNVVSHFVENPLQVHRSAAKRVLRYLAGTKNDGIIISNVRSDQNGQGRKPSGLYGYSDSD